MQDEKHFGRENESERVRETPRGEIDLSHLPISKEEPLSLDVNRGQVGDLDIYSHMAFWLRSSGGSDGKRLSTMWGTWVRSLGREFPWRRKRQPTPILLPRNSHGQRSLVSIGSQRVRHD